MDNGEYQRLYDAVYRELVTPEWRRKLEQLVEHAADPVADERDKLRARVAELERERDTHEAAIVELCLAAHAGPVDVPPEMSRELARLVNAIRINVTMRERAERDRDSYARSDFERQLSEARAECERLTRERDEAVALAVSERLKRLVERKALKIVERKALEMLCRDLRAEPGRVPPGGYTECALAVIDRLIARTP